jgi:hypothetical protein
MSTNLRPFEGTFERNGKKIFTDQGEFLLTPRKQSKQSRSKTGLYLLHIDLNGKRRYVSSLWQQTPDTYELEYARIRYRLTLHDTSAEIIRIGGSSANCHVYHKQLVSKSGTNVHSPTSQDQ